MTTKVFFKISDDSNINDDSGSNLPPSDSDNSNGSDNKRCHDQI